jgi:hypothetical protein
LIFSILASKGILSGNQKYTEPDLAIGLPQFMVTIENFIFAIFFHYSFRSREYHHEENASARRLSTLRAAADALNPTDSIMGIGHTFRLLLGGGLSQTQPKHSYNAVPKILDGSVDQLAGARQYN